MSALWADVGAEGVMVVSLLSGSVAAEVKARQVLATRRMFRYVPEVYM